VIAVRPIDAWIGFAVLIGAAIAPSYLFWHSMRAYASGKEGRLRSLTHLRGIDRWLRIFAVVIGGAALFRTDPPLLEWHHSAQWMYIGVLVIVAGAALLVVSKRTLGWNYSPGFDGYVPFRIVDDGPYRYLRHPIYTARLIIAAGVCLMTGTTWLALAWLVAAGAYWRAAELEEIDLGRWFPIYHLYAQRTNRFVPGIRLRDAFARHRSAVQEERSGTPDVIALTEVEPRRASGAPDAA
jgi:protein-S-isoprenylcysteine O-methyltransferase Ste14